MISLPGVAKHSRVVSDQESVTLRLSKGGSSSSSWQGAVAVGRGSWPPPLTPRPPLSGERGSLALQPLYDFRINSADRGECSGSIQRPSLRTPLALSQFLGYPEMLIRLFLPAMLFKQKSQIVMGVGIIRVQGDRFLKQIFYVISAT